jgi:glycosyltransferase involved in cell wall biosynthesis
MTSTPTLSIGLPVYNGQRYLAEALEALLAQTYADFELVISDNASTDQTESICRAYAAQDDRIRYVRQPVNLGADPNHRYVADQARGRLFKWAAHDDLYEPELLRRCVEALESHPGVVLAHAADAAIDEDGTVIGRLPYELDTADPDPAVRLRSLLYVDGGNDDYGVMYTDVLRRIAPYGAGAYGSDRVFVASMLLHGPFHHVPQVLYYRREHPGRATRAPSKRERVAILDPRMAHRLRYPMARLHAQYVLAYATAIGRAPLSYSEKRRCWGEVAGWLANRARPALATRRTEDDLEAAS